MFFGFDKEGALAVEEDLSYEAYLNGTGAYEGSGPKTPEWAAAITGVPAGTIRALAELYVNGPTATIQGWASATPFQRRQLRARHRPDRGHHRQRGHLRRRLGRARGCGRRGLQRADRAGLLPRGKTR